MSDESTQYAMRNTPGAITGHTTLVGVMGWPVKHSLSPAMHNAAFAELGLDWVYVPLPVYPDHVGEALRGLRALGFAGANVTVPHKQAVLAHLDEVGRAAQVIGAVNTIVVRDGVLYGDNTDAAGFLASLRETGFDPAGTYCALLGAGGAARAVAHALAEAGALQVSVYNRSFSRARDLCRDMAKFHSSVRFEPGSLKDVASIQDDIDLLVNATSLGMWPAIEASPWPGELPIPAHLTVCDLVYNPQETLFLSQARAVGAEIVGGLGMLVHQGAAAFEMWTGRPAPLETMRAACLRVLAGRPG
ncbi:MAG: shikimate dehydrogenase [Anaerolineae bacterium]